MKKIYALLFSMLAVTGVAAQKPVMAAGSTTCYTGSLDVTMMGAPIATGQSATVSMIEDAEGNFTFSLPDFVISVGGSQLECGDIVVEGVTRTDLEGDGVYDIVGSVNDLSLMIFRWRKVRFMRKSTFPARKMPKPAQSIWTLKWVGTRVIPMIWKAQCRSL